MSLTEELVLKRSKARSLEAVRNLNCWGCGLSDVSILARMPNLEVLNIRWVWHYTYCMHTYNFFMVTSIISQLQQLGKLEGS